MRVVIQSEWKSPVDKTVAYLQLPNGTTEPREIFSWNTHTEEMVDWKRSISQLLTELGERHWEIVFGFPASRAAQAAPVSETYVLKRTTAPRSA